MAEPQPINPLENFSLARALRRGGERGEDVARQVAKNYEDLSEQAAEAMRFTPPGMVAKMLREYRRAAERERRAEQFGDQPTVGPGPFAQASGDPGVKMGAMVADPMNLAGAGTVGLGAKAGGAMQKAISAALRGGGEYSLAPRAVSARLGIKPTVSAPERVLFPGVYQNPEEIVRQSAARVAPENPALAELFGVTRADLAKLGERRGNIENPFSLIEKYPANPKGAEHAQRVMTPQNEQRILDVFSEVRKQSPEMWQGMQGWYPMDPWYETILRQVGGDKEEAMRLFNQFNNFSGIESPQMAVVDELRRAAAAHNFAEAGRFPEWMKYGGMRASERGADFPPELRTVPGRIGHVRAAESQRKFLEQGKHGMESPKAPLYIAASGTPETGFQTSIPVIDAHIARSLGLPDVRGAATRAGQTESVTTPELTSLGPWYRDKIAKEVGLEAVPAQGIQWAAFSPQTGVETVVGAPKLELLAGSIKQAAEKAGIPATTMRDDVAAGRRNLGFIRPSTAAGLGVAGAGAVALQRALRGDKDKDEAKPGNQRQTTGDVLRERQEILEAAKQELLRQQQR